MAYQTVKLGRMPLKSSGYEDDPKRGHKMGMYRCGADPDGTAALSGN